MVIGHHFLFQYAWKTWNSVPIFWTYNGPHSTGEKAEQIPPCTTDQFSPDVSWEVYSAGRTLHKHTNPSLPYTENQMSRVTRKVDKKAMIRTSQSRFKIILQFGVLELLFHEI